MKKSIATLCAVTTALASFSGVAAAQGRDHDDRREAREERREARQDRREDRREVRREERRDDRRDTRVVTRTQQTYVYTQPNYVYTQPRYVQTQPRYTYGTSYGYAPSYGYNYSRPYYVGGYVPYGYRQHNYYVNDWNNYGLYQPPYGHQWVRTDTGDFLLMALATGLIASLILNSR